MEFKIGYVGRLIFRKGVKINLKIPISNTERDYEKFFNELLELLKKHFKVGPINERKKTANCNSISRIKHNKNENKKKRSKINEFK